MNCYVCERGGALSTAVAICGSCSVALCRTHLDEELSTPGPGGLRYGCSHDPGTQAQTRSDT
jgi:hypothetical protein